MLCAEDLARARELYARSYELTGRDGILVRSIIGQPTIIPSWDAIRESRARMEARLDELLTKGTLRLSDLPKDVERLPFGLVYQGFNDRILQEKFGALVFQATPSLLQLSPHLLERAGAAHGDSSPLNDAALAAGTRKIRIGFLSKFFTMNHAHGQLLRGVISGLNRDHFLIVVVTIANPQEYLNPEVLDEADEVYHLPLVQVRSVLLGNILHICRA